MPGMFQQKRYEKGKTGCVMQHWEVTPKTWISLSKHMRDYSISIYSDHFSDFDLLTFTVSLNHLLSTFTIFAWFCSPKGWWNHCLCMKISYWSFIPCLNPEMNCALFILWTPINPGSCHAEVFFIFFSPFNFCPKILYLPLKPYLPKTLLSTNPNKKTLWNMSACRNYVSLEPRKTPKK